MPATGAYFSVALRDHVLRRGTIAQACKATGINRQQFNKYLAGDVLPGARTMRKICSYLGVSEEQLMAGLPAVSPDVIQIKRSEIDFGGRLASFSGFLAEASRAKPANRAVLRPGFYRLHVPVHRHPDLVARWLVQVVDGPQGDQLHSCRNRFQDGPALGYAADRICYRGPVVYGPGEACLIGTAEMPQALRGIVFINLMPVVGRDYFSVLVMTRRADGPLALTGALQYLGQDCSPRCALSGMGVIRLDDLAIDPVVLHLMPAPTGCRR